MTIYLDAAVSDFDADAIQTADCDAPVIMRDFLALAATINQTLEFQLKNLVDWDYRQFRLLHDIFLEIEVIRFDMEARFLAQAAAMARFRELAALVERIRTKSVEDNERERLLVRREWRLERATSDRERAYLRRGWAAEDAAAMRTSFQQPYCQRLIVCSYDRGFTASEQLQRDDAAWPGRGDPSACSRTRRSVV